MPEKHGLFFSLRARMVVLFGLLFVALFAASLYLEEFGLSAIGFNGDIRARRTDAFNKLNILADLKKDRLEAWLQERIGDSHVLAEDSVLQAYTQRVDLTMQNIGADKLDRKKIIAIARADRDFEMVRGQLKAITIAYEHSGFYENVKIIDARTGRVIASVIPELLADDALNMEYFKVPAETGQLFVGIGKALITNKLKLYISQPMKTGVLVLRLNLDAVFKTISTTRNALGKTGEVVVINDKSVILAPLRFPLPGGAVAVPLEYHNIGVPALLSAGGKEGIIDAPDYRGVRVLAAYRYLPVSGKNGWGMVIKQDYSEVMAEEYRITIYKALLNSAALLIVLAVAAWIAKSLSDPIKNMATVAEEVEKGGYSARADASDSGEVGLLAQRINSMIAGIATRKEKLEREIVERKNAEREVRALNRELDERVKRRTAALNSANKELESFAYSVSHDLRAPLRGIDGFSLAIMEDYGDKLDDKGRDYLRRIRAGAIKMAELIDDILKLSRITREEMRLEEVDLTLMAKSIADELIKREPERDVEFIINSVNKINGDAKLLRVALENLMDNAFKFTRNTRGARIEFGETKVDDETAVFVRDNGAGFDQSYKDMLFSPFHRLHTNAEFEGTGIGLATVKRVIIRHGGRIWGEGEMGNGATFYFII